MLKLLKHGLLALTALLLGAGIYFAASNYFLNDRQESSDVPQAEATLQQDLNELLAAYRKIIVLFADEKSLSSAEREAVNQVGQSLFHANQTRIAKIETDIDRLLASKRADRIDSLTNALNFIEGDTNLFDADRLAFREVLHSMQSTVGKDGSLQSIKLHKRIGEDLDALGEIEKLYEKELRQIFGRFEPRSIELKRERWSDYVARLKQIYAREQILKDHGVVVPYPVGNSAASATKAMGEEITGLALPAKTLVLTFDDGPHKRYTDEIAVILKQYKVPAIFFHVGHNLGGVNPQGAVSLGLGADVSRHLKANGFTLGNHSFSHAQLSKLKGDSLQAEIRSTDQLLQKIDGARAPLFRFPYGARSAEGMAVLADVKLKSIMWNIDSLDWADPVPSSIAERVIQTVDKEGRGIILFHDIHERTVKALPMILDRLIAQGYQFAGWDGRGFSVQGAPVDMSERPALQSRLGQSWAVVIGIDQYAKWPKLQYAVRDAEGVQQALIEKLGFSASRIITLKNAQATRAGILNAFQDKLAQAGVQKDDRIFVFYAGHGATRQLASGRDLGYIVPVDSDPKQLATDAIAMTDIQNIAEGMTAKHVFFVMDACYSGLGLTRGGASSNYLRDNAKRIGRQMLTAGGTDQLVADGGPNGHSVFTWAFLQGLGGKADLNRDGYISATELAVYVAPAVANASNQTPAFGSLPGSEGGDFIFELAIEAEFISPQTNQLTADAISLNTKLDAAMPMPVEQGKPSAKAPVATHYAVKDLSGQDQHVAVPLVHISSSQRQLAQQANDRGLQLYKEKKYDLAQAQFTEALKLRPDFALAANNLGFVYYKQAKYPEAVRWFENTVKIEPSRAIAYLNLGDAQANVGDKAKAKQSYETFLELAPSSSLTPYVKQQLSKL